MKPCSSCGSWQPSSAYYVDRRGRSRDGRHHACKDCERAAARDRARARYVVKGTMAQPRDSDGRFLYSGRRSVA